MRETNPSYAASAGPGLKLDLAPDLWYTIEVRDWNGKLLRRFSARSRSYVRPWNPEINCQVSGLELSSKDIGGTTRTLVPYSYNLRANEDSYTKSIVIGDDDTAVAISNYCLGNHFYAGWAYQPPSVSTPGVVGSTCSFNIDRVWVNNTGAGVTVKEIGIYFLARRRINMAATFCGVRDVLPSPITVPDSGSIRIIYAIGATAPGFLEGWNKLVHVKMAFSADETIKDTGGTDRSTSSHANDFRANAVAAVTDFGIVVGTGDTAVTISDYALEALIAEGSGAGQLNYQATAFAGNVQDGDTWYFTVQRVMNNNSGGAITVKEWGLYGKMGPTPYYVCLIRKVLDTPVEVADLAALTATFRIQVSL